MFDSGVTAATLIYNLKSEVDVAQSIGDDNYVVWLNSLEQLLYSEVIKELNSITKTVSSPVTSFSVFGQDTAKESVMRFEDIHMIYADGIELTKTTPHTARVLSNVYYKSGDGFIFKKGGSPGSNCSVEISYYTRPAVKKIPAAGSIPGNGMIPYEFLEMINAKLRSEAYKLMNEDNLSAKWMNDYNASLEMFRGWVAQRAPKFGV